MLSLMTVPLHIQIQQWQFHLYSGTIYNNFSSTVAVTFQDAFKLCVGDR